MLLNLEDRLDANRGHGTPRSHFTTGYRNLWICCSPEYLETFAGTSVRVPIRLHLSPRGTLRQHLAGLGHIRSKPRRHRKSPPGWLLRKAVGVGQSSEYRPSVLPPPAGACVKTPLRGPGVASVSGGRRTFALHHHTSNAPKIGEKSGKLIRAVLSSFCPSQFPE